MVTKSISLFGRELVRVERNRAGEFSYTFLDGGNDFINGDKYLKTSLENPVLMTVCTIIARLYSQMRITHVDSNGKVIENSAVIKLLQQPNYFQSQEDWLFQQAWFLSSAGTNLIYQRKAFTNELPKALYNLIPSEIDLNNAHKVDKFIASKQELKSFGERYIKYNLDGKTYNIKLNEIIPLYDLSNGMTDNSFFLSPSRVKGVHKVLQNIDANLASKHKNLQMSAKYLSKNQSTGNEAQIQTNDRTAIERVFSNKDLLVTNTALTVQHLVSDMKKLYLDEQFADDANKVLLAFELNKNVLNYFAKDSTFENQTEGIISFIQNAIQVKADNTMNSLSSSFGLFKRNERLIASYDHLATMQPVVSKKITSFKEMQDAIKIGLENQTLTQAEAKKMSDEFRTKLKL
jgi:hypothetical protein